METNAHRGSPPAKLTRLDRQLIRAIAGDDPGAVESLLAKGARVDLRDPHGFTPAMLACIYGLPRCLLVLVANHADIHALDDAGWTALMAAASDGEAECVGILLRAGAPIGFRDSHLRTPLLCACQNASQATIDLLLDSGADPADTDADRVSAVEHARAQGQHEAADRMSSMLLARRESIEIGESIDPPLLLAAVAPPAPTRL